MCSLEADGECFEVPVEGGAQPALAMVNFDGTLHPLPATRDRYGRGATVVEQGATGYLWRSMPSLTDSSCCSVNSQGICGSGAVVACVCAASPECCLSDWTQGCVDAVEDFGCGVCP